MELSKANNTFLQSTDKSITDKLTESKATPKHGGGVYVPPVKTVSSDTVTISPEATKALNEEPARLYHGGGVYVPPKAEK